MRERILQSVVIICAACLAAWLTGCAASGLLPEPDTVVQIPLHPTQAPAPSETAGSTQPPVPEETGNSMETSSTETNDSGKSSGGGKRPSGSGKSSTKAGRSSDETTPRATVPLETDPAFQTEVPEQTQVPATEPAQAETAAEPAAQSDEPYDISGYTAGSLEYAVLDQINACRAEAALAPLAMDERLCAIASARAFEISQSWSHTRPDGRWFGTVLADYGYSAGSVGEVLAYATAPSADAIVAKWMESGSTRDSLTGDYTTAGVGIYCTGGVTYLACLLVN